MNQFRKVKNLSNLIMSDNRGVSLVELIISIAILVIVGGAVCSFILVGTNSFSRSNNDIGVQQEAQLAVNQMSDAIIDTAGSVNVRIYRDGGSFWLGGSGVMPDANIGSSSDVDADTSGINPDYIDNYDDVRQKLVVLYNGEAAATETPSPTPTGAPSYSGSRQNYSFQILWDKAGDYGEKETLYLAQISVNQPSNGFPLMEGDTDADGNTVEFIKLAEHVEKFLIDLSQLQSKSVVKLTLELYSGERYYKTTHNIKVRNRVGINTIELNDLTPGPSDGTLKPMGPFYVEPGSVLTLPAGAIIGGKNIGVSGCKWEVVSGTSYVTGDSALLSGGPAAATSLSTIGAPNLNGSERVIQLKAITNATKTDGDPLDSTPVTVRIKEATKVTLTRVDSTGAAIPTSTKLNPGEEFIVKSVVSGHNFGRPCSNVGWTDDSAIEDRITSTADYPSSLVDLVSFDGSKNEFTFKVKDNASSDATVEIRTHSRLAAERGYPDIWGSISFGIEEQIHYSSGLLKYGGNSMVPYRNWPNVDPNKATYGVYVRISTNDPHMGDANDKYVFFRTEGNTLSINPDMFGLDWTVPQYIGIQVFSSRRFNNIRDAENQVRVDYQNPANFNSDGSIRSTNNFQVSDMFFTELEVPTVELRLGNKTSNATRGGYSFDNIYVGKTNGLQQKIWDTLSINGLKINGDSNADWQALYFKVEKKGPNDSDWVTIEDVRVRSSRDDPEQYTVRSINNLRFEQLHSNRTAGYRYDHNNLNNGDNKAQVVGEYRLIPYIYHRNTSSDHGNLPGEIFHSSGFTRDYTTMFSKGYPDQALTLNVINPETITLYGWVNDGGNKFREGTMELVLPSDYTNFRNTFSIAPASAWSYKAYEGRLKVGGNTFNSQYSIVASRYNEAQRRYELEFYVKYNSPDWGNINIPVGTYACSDTGGQWTKVDAGPYGAYIRDRATSLSIAPTATGVTLNLPGGTVTGAKMYIPLPRSADFVASVNGGWGFTFGTTNETTRNLNMNMTYFDSSNAKRTVQINEVAGKYIPATGEYHIMLRRGSTNIAAFKSTASASSWENIPISSY